jgi:predicted nucleic acid-binding protein
LTTWVIDASVVAAAVFHETHGESAQRILASRDVLIAPDLILAEVANVIWKRHQRGELDDSEANDLLADVQRLPLQLIPTPTVVHSALALATRIRRTVYDCTYLALSLELGAVMLTGDRRLVNSLERSPMSTSVRWIGALSE